MRTSLTSRQLEVLCAVIECGGFAAAARSLEISQAAISKQVHVAESKLGFRVFVHRPGVVPQLSARGRRLVQELPELTQKLHAISLLHAADSGAPETIRIGCGDAIAEMIARNLRALYQAIPNIVIEIRHLDPSVSSAFRLQDQDIDLAYFTLRYAPSDRMGESIGSVNGGLYAIPAICDAHAARPDDAVPLISVPEASALNQNFTQVLPFLGVHHHRIVARLSGHRDRLRLVLDGVGATLVLEEYVREYIASGALRLIGSPVPLHRLRFIAPRRAMHPTIRRVESFLTRLLNGAGSAVS